MAAARGLRPLSSLRFSESPQCFSSLRARYKQINPLNFHHAHQTRFQSATAAAEATATIPSQVPPDEPELQTLPDLDPSQLIIQETKNPKILTKPEELIFGSTFTDHMFSAEWTTKTGWHAPRITPYQNFSLDPATSVFHYAFCCFEGMKAYKDAKGKLRLFRPEQNMARLNRTAPRIALPGFNVDAGVELLKRYCRLEERHIPPEKGYSLYLRPTMIGTHRALGVGPSASALFYIIACPVGPYYKSGFKAVNLLASADNIRAWPGGVGNKKLGANYAPTIVPQMHAAERGFSQTLWLFKDESPEGKGEDYVTEVGMMNLFAAFQHRDGTKELVTPPLDGTILEGITRDSMLQLARERMAPQGWKVNERKFTMREVAEASEEGRLIEVFGAGTAAVVCPVRMIEWRGKRVNCNLKEGEEIGPIGKQMKEWIEAIQYGDEEHPWSVLVD